MSHEAKQKRETFIRTRALGIAMKLEDIFRIYKDKFCGGWRAGIAGKKTPSLIWECVI